MADFTPVNYTGMQIQADPVGSFLKAAQMQAQTGLMNSEAQQVQQSAIGQQLTNQRAQSYQNAYQNFSANPTPQGAIQLAAAYPEIGAHLPGAWQQYNEQARQQELTNLAPVVASLQNNRYDLASQLLQNHIDAINNTPGADQDPQMQKELAGARQLQQSVQNDAQTGGKGTLAGLYGTLAAAMGPQDFMTHFGQGQTMGPTIATASIAPAQAQANVGLTNAQTADVNSIIANRAGQFGLDQQRLQADVGFKLRAMNYEQNAPAMQPEMRAQADQAAVDSVAYGQMADRTGNLAQQIGAMDQNGKWVSGVPGNIVSGWQNLWGSQGDMNTLRQEYQQVMGTLGAFGGAGVSSGDKKNLSPGIPAKDASPGQIKEFLQSFQNAQVRAARIADAKSSWAYSFGRLGPATSDQTIGGVQVAKGTSFPQFMSQMLKTNSTAPSPFPAPNANPGVQTGAGTGGQPFSGGLSYLNKYTGQ
ncbi:hypothetical protein [Burkholderia glumae]